MIERSDWAFDNPYDDDEVLCDDCGQPLYEVEDEDGKTIREVRDLNLRISGEMGKKCTFETVIIRLIKAGHWFGTTKHRQFITQNVQRRNWKSQKKND